jgi:hypothetical protein
MRYIWFICICLTLVVGGFTSAYIVSNPKYEHTPRWYRGHFRTIKEHLQTISTHLKTYYAQNNRYPDNNEGLSALKSFKEELIGKQPNLPPPMGISEDKSQDSYKFDRFYDNWKMVSFEGGILSPWFEPFVYENRRGLSDSLFTDSPANPDKEQYYSIKVDDGIYIYSVGAMLYAQEYKTLLAEIKMMNGISIAIVILEIVLVIVFIRLFIKARKPAKEPQKWWVRGLKTAGRTLLVLLSVVIGPVSIPHITCYVMTSFGLYRRPEMITQYNALLDKYRQRGVINDQTYQKIKQGLAEVDNLIEEKKIR